MNDSLRYAGETLFESPPDLLWVRDEIGILLTRPAQAGHWLLTGLEAEVWDLLASGRPVEEALQLISAMTGSSPAEARTQLLDMAEAWSERGFITANRTHP